MKRDEKIAMSVTCKKMYYSLMADRNFQLDRLENYIIKQ